MNIKVREWSAYVEMSYIIDSAKFYEEVIKLHNTFFKNQEVKFYKNNHSIKGLQFTENDVITVYLNRNGADWLKDYDAVYDSGYKETVWDYILGLCDEVECDFAIGNRRIEDFGQIDRTEREVIKNGDRQ